MVFRPCARTLPFLAIMLLAMMPAKSANADLGMMLTDVDIRFNRAAQALNENLVLTLEECSNGEKSVCRYRVNENLEIIGTAPGPGRNLEQLVGIYVNNKGRNMREAVLMNELLVAMTVPDLPAKERVGLVDKLLYQLGRVRTPVITVDRLRYRLDITNDNSLFLFVEAAR